MMETNKCKLSDGANAVLNLMEHEPTTPKFRNVDPTLINELETILYKAEDFTSENMSWLNGVYINPDKLSKIFSLIDKIRKALNEGARFENDFWTGVEESRKANVSFMKTLMSGVESGNIIFKQKDGETKNDETDSC